MYKTIDINSINFEKENVLLIVTATPLETENVHANLIPLKDENLILQAFHNTNAYYIGKFCNYFTVHVQCNNMGSTQKGASHSTVAEALEKIKPNFLLMIGIAFGLKDSQNIGDVLFSKSVMPYNYKKIGPHKEYHRGKEGGPKTALINRFENLSKNWKYEIKEGINATCFSGQILSGEELINNEDRRKELIDAFPEAIGGEMEGAGIYAAADDKVNWMIVKGICDFADGNKDTDKNLNQNWQLMLQFQFASVFSVTKMYLKNLD